MSAERTIGPGACGGISPSPAQWHGVAPLCPEIEFPDYEEDARLEAEIAADPDDPAYWGAPFRPAGEVLPEVVQAHREGALHPASPGALLRVALQERGISQRRLAAMMGRPANAVSEIILSKRSSPHRPRWSWKTPSAFRPSIGCGPRRITGWRWSGNAGRPLNSLSGVTPHGCG